MTSYTVQVHLYGSVAVVTLCAGPDRAHAGSGEDLVWALDELGKGVVSVVLDLDCAPAPAPARALAAVGAWAAGRDVTVVVLAPAGTSGARFARGGARWPGVLVLRTGPAGAGLAVARDEAVVVQGLRRAVAGRALASQAVGIRQARGRAHPCS
ncbi:hypothetical protein EF912_27455 [Streptomyces sp. WAC07061]|uniref:hypothetical protein n=1 Tax=Streptomyces sp. WAC07061 TaxID=2487410 RepID=UPI000F76F863|nr:hypothetical protein [Streptomyces sp. WAC07061]RSS46501.1 hypothetical protein EF912_27455 [Streptomyces sp. WAC07061]